MKWPITIMVYHDTIHLSFHVSTRGWTTGQTHYWTGAYGEVLLDQLFAWMRRELR